MTHDEDCRRFQQLAIRVAVDPHTDQIAIASEELGFPEGRDVFALARSIAAVYPKTYELSWQRTIAFLLGVTSCAALRRLAYDFRAHDPNSPINLTLVRNVWPSVNTIDAAIRQVVETWGLGSALDDLEAYSAWNQICAIICGGGLDRIDHGFRRLRKHWKVANFTSAYGSEGSPATRNPLAAMTLAARGLTTTRHAAFGGDGGGGNSATAVARSAECDALFNLYPRGSVDVAQILKLLGLDPAEVFNETLRNPHSTAALRDAEKGACSCRRPRVDVSPYAEAGAAMIGATVEFVRSHRRSRRDRRLASQVVPAIFEDLPILDVGDARRETRPIGPDLPYDEDP